MFLKDKVLKRLMKQAYKLDSLQIGNTGDELYIAGVCWELSAKKEFIPKTILATIIELAGEFPELGQYFTVGKDGNQIEIGLDREACIPENVREIEVTDVMIADRANRRIRILQDPVTNQIQLIDEVFVEAVDKQAANYEKKEHEPDGPLYGPDKGVYWVNNVMRFHVCVIRDENRKPMLNAFEGFRLKAEEGQ